MNIMELIQSRRTVKVFKSDALAMDDVTTWLRAASYAPNHRMTQPWEVRVIGEETREKLNHKTNFGGAPVVLAVLCEPAKTPADHKEYITAVGCFIQNFMLAAASAGVGTGWTSFGAGQTQREILGVPEGYEVIGLIPVGHPEEIPSVKERTPIETKIKVLP